jgi:hypothetical protein
MKNLCTFFAILIFSGCGTTVEQQSDDLVRVTGLVEVLLAGTRSETVILEDAETGDVYALVGEVAYEFTESYGCEVAITAKPTEEGWSVRDELPKLWVVEYTVLSSPEDTDQN